MHSVSFTEILLCKWGFNFIIHIHLINQLDVKFLDDSTGELHERRF